MGTKRAPYEGQRFGDARCSEQNRRKAVTQRRRSRADSTGRAQPAICRGYEQATRWPLRERDVRLHAALALFELSLRPFRCLMPEWPERTMAILARAEALLPT